MMSWPDEVSDEGDWGNAGTSGLVGAAAGAGVAGAGFDAALGAAAGDWAKVLVENILANSTRSEKKMICFIFLLVILKRCKW
jgi:hypothetical protein